MSCTFLGLLFTGLLLANPKGVGLFSTLSSRGEHTHSPSIGIESLWAFTQEQEPDTQWTQRSPEKKVTNADGNFFLWPSCSLASHQILGKVKLASLKQGLLGQCVLCYELLSHTDIHRLCRPLDVIQELCRWLTGLSDIAPSTISLWSAWTEWLHTVKSVLWLGSSGSWREGLGHGKQE